jgi:TP53 regulating kinase-like protein
MIKKLLAQANEKHSQNKKNNIDECFSVGAEAKIFREENFVIKDRISKSYRHPILDKKIIKQRTKREKTLLEKASKLIPSPKPEQTSEENIIKMPYINGKKLSENLENLDWKKICKIIGQQIAKLHDNNIIHGDLTTSNMIYVEGENKEKPKIAELKTSTKLNPSSKITTLNNKIKEIGEQVQPISKNPSPKGEGKLFFIDFGLSFTSARIEDKAVDLHLIKQALEAKHFSIHKEAEKIILENYNSKDKAKVLEQLKKVEARGRYKH